MGKPTAPRRIYIAVAATPLYPHREADKATAILPKVMGSVPNGKVHGAIRHMNAVNSAV